MKGGILMRVLFCKIQSPFICFCRSSSSAHHLYASGPGTLKLENRPHAVAVALVPSSSENVVPKSCLRRLPRGQDANSLKEAEKKSVQWIDFCGKELAQINEFESSETGDTDDEVESSQGCLCSIL